jgi:hypothetical protein
VNGKPIDIAALSAAVQHNCHIADARHAGELTMCTYLLQMREFWRWEHRLPLGAPVDRSAVGPWLAGREALWDRVQGDDWRPLPLPGGVVVADPFEVDRVNAAVRDGGWIYGAGMVGRARPVFFLARVCRHYALEGLEVVEASEEVARTLLAPPAALAGGAQGPVLLRRQAMARWCWERTEGVALRPAGRAAQAADPTLAMVRHYGLDRDFHAGLQAWLDDQCATALQHELAEHRLNMADGEAWAGLRKSLPEGRPLALLAALRDLLADLGHTLPRLLQGATPAGALHTWFAGFDGLRSLLFPGLPAAYAAWRAGDQGQALRSACSGGQAHFDALATTLRAAWHAEGEGCAPAASSLLASPAAVMAG